MVILLFMHNLFLDDLINTPNIFKLYKCLAYLKRNQETQVETKMNCRKLTEVMNH